MKLSLKFSLAVVLLLAITLGVTAKLRMEQQTQALMSEGLRRTQTVLAFGEACREYARNTLAPAVTKHTDALILEARSATFVARGVFDALKKKLPEYSFHEAALNPLNPRNLADEVEESLIRRFQADGKLEELTGLRTRNGREELYVARPIAVTAACMECHESPAKAPPEIVARYGSEHGFGWKLGEVSSAVMVTVPTDDLREGWLQALWAVGWGYAAAAIVLMILIPVLFHALVGKRLREVSQAIEGITAKGDLSKRLDDSSSDEIGAVSRVFNEMADQLAAERQKGQEHTKSLEGMVEDRTRHLEDALQHVERASQQKTRFLASMSHEIRTPIGAILGYAEILEEQNAPPDERRQALTSIRRNGEHLIELVNEILDLSKIEAGKLELDMIECSVGKILKDVVSVMSVRANLKGLRIDEVFLTPIPSKVVTDPTRVRQVLINLVGNAVKFTERGLITIAVSFSGDENEPGKLEFRVQDTGIGIAPEKVDLLFNPFQQLGAETSRKYGGTGLGLAISRQLARLLGGDIEVRSDPGLGSLFTFSVACVRVKGTTMHRRPASAVLEDSMRDSSRRNEEARLGSLRGTVLVVDDGTDNRKLFCHHLEGAGVKVELAENGKEGAEKAAASSYDLILMDIQMPILDGFEALKEIRGQGIKTPIVALTAHAMKGDREKCLAAGFTDYLSKPVSRSALLAKVATFVKPPEEPPPGIAEPGSTSVSFESIVAEFRAGLEGQASALKHAMSAEDFPALRRLAHGIKGTAGAMGFDRIAELVTNAYATLEGPRPRDALPILRELEAACRQASAEKVKA